MKRMFATVLLALAATSVAAPARAAGHDCTYHLGFQAIYMQIPEEVGACLDNEAYATNGDALQHSAGGLLAWRRSDNWTAFTDGYRTWVNGPYGLQQRLNTERFPWENDVPGGFSSAG